MKRISHILMAVLAFWGIVTMASSCQEMIESYYRAFLMEDWSAEYDMLGKTGLNQDIPYDHVVEHYWFSDEGFGYFERFLFEDGKLVGIPYSRNDNGAFTYSLTDKATMTIRLNKTGESWTIHVDTNNDEFVAGGRTFKLAPLELIEQMNVWADNSAPESVDLSKKETANCYIVERADTYSFNATIMGNGAKGIMMGYDFHTTNPVITPQKAKLLWQDGEIVSDILLHGGRVYFNASGNKGNAVIAVTNASDEILWSWHIWATDYPKGIQLTENTPTYLDRNLGATTTTPGLESTNGLYYQWGRKDPFPATGFKVAAPSSPLTAAAMIKNPDTFFAIEGDFECGWVAYPSALWGNPDGPASSATHKTIYDPCPAGYTIPSDDVWYEYDDDFHSRPWEQWGQKHKYYSLFDPTIEYEYSEVATIARKNNKSICYPQTKSLTGAGLTDGGYYVKNNLRYQDHASAGYLVPYYYDEDNHAEYHLSAYNNTRASWGNPIRCIKEKVNTEIVPTSSTLGASSVNVTNLILNGTIEDTGNSPIVKYGFIWGIDRENLNNEVISSDAQTANYYRQSFSYRVTELPPHTIIYYKAFAENSKGRGYGEIMSAQLITATECAVITLDSLSRFMTNSYLNTQGMNGEGTIRLWYSDMTGSAMAHNHSNWASLYNLNYLSKDDSPYTLYPMYYYYRIINKVNTTLDKYMIYANDTDVNINYYKAALLGYRAYAYMMLAQLYCKGWNISNNGSSLGLPLRISADDDVTTISSLSDVYQQIYSDLDLALSFVKESGYVRKNVNEIDKSVLYAIYAKAALNRNDYLNAAKFAKLAREGHPLMTNAEYNSGFNKSNNEWIWGAHPKTTSSDGIQLYYYSYFAYIGYNSNSTICRNYPKCISKELFNKIPNTDIRKKLFLNPEGYAYDTETGEAGADLKGYAINYAKQEGRVGLDSRAKVYSYMQFKFASSFMPGGGQQNFIRSAEMILTEAEANYYLGNEGEVRNLLNNLNTDSGRDPSYNCTKTGSDLFDEIKTYRRIELWGEGYDFFDVKRWNDPIIRKTFAEGGNFITKLAGTWTATDKNDYVWVYPNNYEEVIRAGSGY